MLRSQESFGNSKLIFRRFAMVFFPQEIGASGKPTGRRLSVRRLVRLLRFSLLFLDNPFYFDYSYNSLSFLSIPYHSWWFHFIHCHSLPFLTIPFLIVPFYSLPFLISRYHSIPLLIILYHCKSKYTNLLKHKRIWNWSTGCEGTIQKWNESFPGVKKCQVKGSPLSGCQVYRWSYFQNDDDRNTKFFNWFSRYA